MHTGTGGGSEMEVGPWVGDTVHTRVLFSDQILPPRPTMEFVGNGRAGELALSAPLMCRES